MQVEDVARVGLAARRAAKQQRELTVGDGLLREIIVDDERVLAVVAEVLAHRAARVGRDELQRGRITRRGGDDDRVLHRAVLRELVDHLRHGRLLLTGGDVDAEDVGVLLVDDRVDRDRGLARLAVADDQLALSAPDRGHGVDRLDAGHQRLVHRLAADDAGRLHLDELGLRVLDRPLAIDGVAEAVDDATEQPHAGGHLDDLAGATHQIAFANAVAVAHDGDTDVVLLEVQHHSVDTAGEFDELAGQRLLEAVDACDAVTGRQHGARLRDVDLAIVVADLSLQDVGDLARLDVHVQASCGVGSALDAQRRESRG